MFSDDLAPKRTGLRLELDGSIYPAAWDVEETFGGIEGSLSGYWGAARWLTLAGRAGGRHVTGKHPWHESAFIGGSPNVRGYDRNRFAGDTSLYTNLEARIGIGVSGWSSSPPAGACWPSRTAAACGWKERRPRPGGPHMVAGSTSSSSIST